MDILSPPLYKQIAEKLHDELWRFKPGEAFFSDRDVARLHQTSCLTARRAVMQLVEGGLLDRIERKGTFVRDPAKQLQLAPVLSSATGIDSFRFIHYLSNSSILEAGSYFSSVYTTCAQYIRQAGNDLVFSSLSSVEDVQILPKVIRERGEKGVLLASMVGESLCKQLRAIPGLPIVAIDSDYSHLGIDSVTWNFHEVGKQAAETLLNAGHRQLAFVGMKVSKGILTKNPELAVHAQWPNAQALYDGFKQGIEQWQSEYHEPVDHCLSTDSMDVFTAQLLRDKTLPTGYFCFNGAHARSLNRFMAAHAGADKPCRFISWSEPSADAEEPSLSENLVHPSSYIIGRYNACVLGSVAMQVLQHRIAHPNSPVRNNVLLPINLDAQQDLT